MINYSLYTLVKGSGLNILKKKKKSTKLIFESILEYFA